MAVQVGLAQTAPGAMQGIAVVGPANASISVVVTFTGGMSLDFAGSSNASGVYRITFTVPASARQGTASVLARTAGGTGAATFTVE